MSEVAEYRVGQKVFYLCPKVAEADEQLICAGTIIGASFRLGEVVYRVELVREVFGSRLWCGSAKRFRRSRGGYRVWSRRKLAARAPKR